MGLIDSLLSSIHKRIEESKENNKEIETKYLVSDDISELYKHANMFNK